MKQSKFPWAVVLLILSILGLGFILFLSLNYKTLGDTGLCLIITSIHITLLALSAFAARKFKEAGRRFTLNKIFEISSLVLSISLALVSILLINNFFVIQSERHALKVSLNESIKNSQEMFIEYQDYVKEREGSYKGELNSAVKNQRSNSSNLLRFGFKENGISYVDQIDNKMNTIHNELIKNTVELKVEANKWFDNAEGIVRNWNPISIIRIVNEISENSQDWKSQLIDYSKFRQMGEQAEDFNYNLEIENVAPHFSKDEDIKPISIVLGIIGGFLILLSYFIAERSSKRVTGDQRNPEEVAL